MDLDEHGLPRPEDFHARRRSSQVTKTRLAALLAVIVASGLAALAIAYAPDLEKIFDAQLGGRGARARRGAELGRELARAMDAKDWSKADALSDKLCRGNPMNPQAHILRAEVLSRLDRHQEAIAACTTGLALTPDDPLLLNNRAYFRALARVEMKEALADIEAALGIARNPSYLDTRGYILYLSGKFDAAAKDYDDALRAIDIGELGQEPADSAGEILFHRGLLRKATGDAAGMKRDFAAARARGFAWKIEPMPLAAAAEGRPAP